MHLSDKTGRIGTIARSYPTELILFSFFTSSSYNYNSCKYLMEMAFDDPPSGDPGNSIPEPSSLALFGISVVCLIVRRRMWIKA